MPIKLTTGFTSFHAWEVHLARHMLEQEGIESYIADENVVSANWIYANAVGGVKLRVPGRDAERARSILASTHIPQRRPEANLSNCPDCGRTSKYSTLWRCICAVGTFLLLGVPLLFRHKQ